MVGEEAGTGYEIVSQDKLVNLYDNKSYLLEEGVTLTLGSGFSVNAAAGETFEARPRQYEEKTLTNEEAMPLAHDEVHNRPLGYKQYELKDHLGNVRAVISDRKTLEQGADELGNPISYYQGELMAYNHYYPFGMDMASWSSDNFSSYRYGFNGKEKDDKGEFGSKTTYDYGFRIYNTGIGKFLSVDPLTRSYPWYTPYQFAGNKPIWAVDLDGLEELIANDGKVLGVGPFSEKTKTKKLNDHAVKRLIGEQIKILYPNSQLLSNVVGTDIKRSSEKIEVSQYNAYEEPIKITRVNIVGRSANERAVTDFSATILHDAAQASGDNEIDITSTFRDPVDQARVMYNNLKIKSIESQRRLYRNGRGIDVIDMYELFNGDPGCSTQECLNAMALTIKQVGPGNVSKHAEDINILNTIDIGPSSLSNQGLFVDFLRSLKDVRKVVTPDDDPAVHTEIKQPGQTKY